MSTNTIQRRFSWLPPVVAIMEINRNDIKQGDVQIVDRQFLDPEQIKNSFYHELIRNCAEKLDRNANVVQPATRMVDIVAKKRQGRFIFIHHTINVGNPVRFYLLSREEAISKLSSDLAMRLHEMNKPPAGSSRMMTMMMQQRPSLSNSSVGSAPAAVGARPEPAASPVKKPKASTTNSSVGQLPASLLGGTDTPLKYAIRLVLKVCMAEMDEGKSPLEAARVLNRSVLTNGEVETPKQRKLRLQMRLRFLAVARTETSVFGFARNLLLSWGVDVITKKKNIMISSVPGFKFENDAEGFPKSHPISFLEHDEVVHKKPPPASAVAPTEAAAAAAAADEHDNRNGCASGTWTTAERHLFVKLVDKHGWANWRDVRKDIPQRYVCRRPVYLITLPSSFLSRSNCRPHFCPFVRKNKQDANTSRHFCPIRVEELRRHHAKGHDTEHARLLAQWQTWQQQAAESQQHENVDLSFGRPRLVHELLFSRHYLFSNPLHSIVDSF
jgi:hypothetical protein